MAGIWDDGGPLAGSPNPTGREEIYLDMSFMNNPQTDDRCTDLLTILISEALNENRYSTPYNPRRYFEYPYHTAVMFHQPLDSLCSKQRSFQPA